MLLVVISPERGKEEIIATGGFFQTEDPSEVEMAWVVRKDWRGNGITRILLDELVLIARELRYRSFCAHVIEENEPMMHILKTSGYLEISKEREDDIIKFTIDIRKMIDIDEYVM